MDRYITRLEAFDVIESLIESDILSDEICDQLHSIAECIEEERYCRHIWGGDPEEICELYTAHREDLITPEIINRCAEIHEKYEFKPASFESDLHDDDDDDDECDPFD